MGNNSPEDRSFHCGAVEVAGKRRYRVARTSGVVLIRVRMCARFIIRNCNHAIFGKLFLQDNEPMNDVDIVEDCVFEEDDPHNVGSTCHKITLKRQTTLDAFFSCGPNRKTISNDEIVRKKAKNNRMLITVTHSVISKNKLNSRKSFGSVVEEVNHDEDGEQSHCNWARMSDIMDKAKTKTAKTTVDAYLNVSPNSACGAPLVKKILQPNVVESVRCYGDMFPDLNSRSASDVVLICLSSIRSGTSPKPYPIACTDPTYGWNFGKKYVRLPYSICNIIDGTPRFDTIQTAISKLLEPLKTYKQIEECIRSYSHIRCFDALKQFFEVVLDDVSRVEYLTTVIPFMAKLALQSPNLITQPIPLLRRGISGSVTMSQQQAASLLAHAFFCTFPSRNIVSNELPSVNFCRLFSLRTTNVMEKLRCLMHYFHIVSKKMPTGLLTFRRQHDSAPKWSSMHLPLSKLYVIPTGRIEDDGHGMLQVDFANEYIGGGVLSSGCVQEEIRFLICPEMIVAMLLCERMSHNEAIVICGAERFSDYIGYGSSFRWRPVKKLDSFPRDRFSRLCCELVAIDALPFSNKREQFDVELVDRELLKAYVGFAVKDRTVKPIATGNWGCGVFGGLIQLIASSAQKRCLCYFTFGDRKFADDFNEIYEVLVRADTTIGRLYDMIKDYCIEYDENSSPSLFTYISWKIKEDKLHLQ
uniref:poly(ADP-ribose) glycohydrolase n=1 Tax=Setaria digitata TaxID=48799 RepID=A0A915PYA7_9BILA